MKLTSRILALTIFILFTKNVSAQRFLVSGGLVMAGTSTFENKGTTSDWDFNIYPGLHFGAMIERPISNKWSLEMGIIMNSQSKKLVAKNTNRSSGYEKRSHLSLMLPISVKLFTGNGDVKHYVKAGLYGGTVTSPGFILPGFENDYGFTFGTGIEKGNMQYGISYVHGLPSIPLTGSGDQSVNNRSFLIFAAYIFGNK